MRYCGGNQLVITDFMFCKQRGWMTSMDNLISINLSHLFNSYFFAPVSLNNVAPQIVLGHRQSK